MKTRNLVWLTMLFAIGAIFYGLAPIMARRDAVYRTYAPLVEVDAFVRREFVTPTKPRRLVDGAVRGMLRDLDAYSGYVAPDEMDAFTRKHSGEYIGVGMELGLVAGVVTVIAPIDQSPAARAGIRPGDVIVAVDGTFAEELSVFEVDQLLSGEAGDEVSLSVRRRDNTIDTITIERAPVRRSLVEGFDQSSDGAWNYIVDPEERIAYLRITHFSEGVSREFERALSAISDETVNGLIVDLRSNPGGLMPEAIAVVDRFIDSGVILRTVTRRQAVDTYVATAVGTDARTPLVILINGGSASSAEIVAGSLQDRGRAVVVGERSFGKGSVQSFFKLSGGGGLKLTVAHYQFPGGRVVHKTTDNAHTDEWGVIPDINVPTGEIASDDRDPQLQAAIDTLSRLTP